MTDTHKKLMAALGAEERAWAKVAELEDSLADAEQAIAERDAFIAAMKAMLKSVNAARDDIERAVRLFAISKREFFWVSDD